MPKKKLIVKDIGAGDPTLAMVIQIENTDPKDTSTDMTFRQVSGILGSDIFNSPIENPILLLQETTFPIGRDILIMSSFIYNAPDPTFENGIIPATMDVMFDLMPDSEDSLEFVNDTNPRLESSEDSNTISFMEINAIPAKAPTLKQNLAASLQAVADTQRNQGKYVFLKGNNSGAPFTLNNSFASSAENLMWDIVYYEDGDYYTIQNRENKKFLGSSKDYSSYLCWYTWTSYGSDVLGLQWKITIQDEDHPNLILLQSSYAKSMGVGSYLTADTENGVISLSDNGSSWYLHNINQILADG